MNKTSYMFVSIGVIVLAILGYFILSSNSKPEPIQNNQTNQQPTNPAPTEPPPPAFVEAVFEYHSDMVMEPKVIRVTEGQKVVIRATADVTDEVHLHGYNNSVPIKPGEQVSLEFTADKTGRFPVELEELKKDIGIIEVYPK